MVFEVEVKARVEDPEAVRKLLRGLAEYRGSFHKEDLYFSRKGEIKSLFRIRREGGRSIVTYKEKSMDPSGVEKNREHEFEVDDYLEFVKFSGYLGFVEFSQKNKHGEVYNYRGAVVELSFVEYLGWFIEIECLAEREEEAEQARGKVLEILSDLGISESCIEHRYYNDMLLEIGKAKRGGN
jgi:predicted adenylyl cyclase CyaB